MRKVLFYSHSLGFIPDFATPLAVGIERAEGHFCPNVVIVDYPNVSALLSECAAVSVYGLALDAG